MPHRLAFTINNKTLVIRQRFLFTHPFVKFCQSKRFAAYHEQEQAPAPRVAQPLPPLPKGSLKRCKPIFQAALSTPNKPSNTPSISARTTALSRLLSTTA